MDRQLTTHSVEETKKFAEAFVAELGPGTVLALHGNLGAGKTSFTQGLAAGLHIESIVNSPTYTLIHEYKGGDLPLFHIDLYRIQDVEEAADLALEDFFEGPGITAVEWPEKAGDLIPPDAIHISLENLEAENDRRLIISETAP